MNAVITKYSPKDQQKVKELILSELAKFGFGYNRKYDADLDNPEKHYIQPGGMFYVLKDREGIVGTIAIINRGKSGELKRFYVKENLQGHGFGTKLLTKALQFCQDKNFSLIELETNKKFEKAHAFYQKHGFRVVNEDKTSYYLEKKI